MAEKAESKSPVTSAPVILALEASGNAASAAVLIDGKIAGMAEHKARHGHAETLILLAEKAICAADCPLSDITHIAAGCGPGSLPACGYVYQRQRAICWQLVPGR